MISATSEEKPTARLVTRVPENVHRALSEAAALVGATVNQFVVQSALERAQHILEHEHSIFLSSQASKKFVEALENPPEPNEPLKEAFRAHREHFGCEK